MTNSFTKSEWIFASALCALVALAPWSSAVAFNNWGEFAAWCSGTGGTPLPNPPRCLPRAGPSPQVLEEQQQKMDETSLHDANDRGADCFRHGDWACAIQNFRNALQFSPDDDVILDNLHRAEAAQAETQQREEAQRRATAEAEAARIQAEQENNTQIAALARSIRSIRVPPPIPPEEALINFGELPESPAYLPIVEDIHSVGLALLEVSGTIGEVTLPASKVILIAGKSFIAAENGALVFLVRQDALYQKALDYLKNGESRAAFNEIVRALKEGRPVPENASIDMVRAAQAITDPKLGNSARSLLWDAFLSPEAKNAVLTQFSIDAMAEVLGRAAGEVVKHVDAARYPMYEQASSFLSKARDALRRTTDPETQHVLQEAIRYADHIIAEAYRTSGHQGMAAVAERYLARDFDRTATHAFEKHQESSAGDR